MNQPKPPNPQNRPSPYVPRPASSTGAGPGGRYANNQQNQNKNRVLMNHHIRVPEVRLISSSGEQLGIVATDDAMRRATQEDLDLVIIGAHQTPPVAKLMNYGKYKFELEKQEKENKKKKRSQGGFKEVKMSPRIDIHDLEIKQKKICEWLSEGNKVQVIVTMKGRETQHPELARQILENILSGTASLGKSERTPAIKHEGRNMSLILAPNSSG